MHVKGHQDRHCSVDSSTQLEALNVEVDPLAKGFLPNAMNQPRQFLIDHEPRALWYSNSKILSNLQQTVHNIGHSDNAKTYWESKQSLSQEVINEIDWDSMDIALKEVHPNGRLSLLNMRLVCAELGSFSNGGRSMIPLLAQDAQPQWRIQFTSGCVPRQRDGLCGICPCLSSKSGWRLRRQTRI